MIFKKRYAFQTLRLFFLHNYKKNFIFVLTPKPKKLIDMSYQIMEKTYKKLTVEQQRIIYNLAVLLLHLNVKAEIQRQNKRTFGKFAGRSKAVFSDNWEITEEELCAL